jgi:polyisoprenoid-binding protein YceI
MKIRRLFLVLLSAGALAARLPAAEQTVQVDKTASHIDLAVKATGDAFTGKLADFAPSVTLDSATGRITAAKISFHFNDVKTGNEKRDREMHVWQQTDKFPDGDFTLGALTASADGKISAQGTLTLHGVTLPLTFPVAIARAGAGVTVEGDAVVDTRAYGLPIIRKFGVLKVDPLVGVHVHLAGTLATP